MKNTFRASALLLSLFTWLITGLFAGPAMAASIDLQVTTYTYTNDPTPITNGGNVTFTLLVEQNSAATSAPSTLTVALPSNVTYQSDASGCSFSAPNLTCPIPALAQAASTTVTYIASGNGAGAVPTTAVIAAGSGDSDANSGNNTLAKTVTVIKGADLTVAHVGPGGCTSGCTATAGSSISFTLTVANGGPDPATGFRVVDNLPALVDFTYQSVTAADWSCNLSGTTLTCDYTGPAVASLSSASTIVVNGQIITSAGSITNGASVASTDATTGDPDQSNNGPVLRVVTVTAGTDLQANSALVSVATGLTTLLTGDAATLTLSATNNGTQQATGVTVTDSIPGDFSIGTLPGGCTAAGSNITCTVGTLNASATSSSFVIPLTVTAAGGTSGSNTANVTRVAPVAGNNTPSSTNYNVVTPFSNLSITKSKSAVVDVSPGGSDPVQTGQKILNTVVVTNDNSSTSDVTGTVTVIETFANTNETFDALTAGSASAGWGCVDGGLTVTCTFAISGSLTRGNSLPNLVFTSNAVGSNVTLSNEVCTGGTISSHVPPDDDTTADCSGSRTIYSALADTDIGITKAVNDSNIDVSENSFRYTIVVTNHSGTDTAPTINVTDVIPMYYNGDGGTSVVAPTVVGAGAGESCSGTSTVNCVIKNLAPGASKTITIRVDRPVQDGSFTNTVSWDSPDTVQTTNAQPDTASIGISIDPIADAAVTNIANAPDPIKVGVAMTYTTSIKNNGPSTAAGVVLRHVFEDSKMAYQTGTASLTGSGDTCSFVNSFVGAPHAGLSGIECTGFSMTDGESRQLTFDVLPTFSFWSGNTPGTYSSDASITTTTTESDSPGFANNTDNNVANIENKDLDLAVTKVEATGYDPDGAGPLPSRAYDPVAFGDQIKYLVTLRNNGPSLATEVIATDVVTPSVGQTAEYVGVTVDSGNYTPANGVSCSITGGATPGTNASPQAFTCYLSAGAGDIANSILPTGRFVTLEMTFNTGGVTPASSVSYSTTSTIRSAETGVAPYAGDTLPISNTVTINTTVLPRTDLYLTKTVDAGADGDNSPFNINEIFNYTITIGNIGTSDATGVQVTDSLPSGFVAAGNVTVASGLGVSLSTNTCNGVAWAGTCDLGPLPIDATGSDTTKQVVITIPVRTTTSFTGPFASNITNTASIAPLPNTSIDTNATNDTGTVNVQITKSSIAGFVYEDNNDDALKGSGENGITSVTLTLTGTDKYGTALNIIKTTSGTGAFLFDSLPPDNGSGYVITETHPPAYVDGQENASGTIVPNSNTTDVISAITLPANTALTGYLFGELGASSTTGILSGYVYNDGSDDGVRDPENPGIENVTITLTGSDTNGAVNKTTTTAANGSYSFPNLLPGTYILTQTQPAGYDDHIDTVGQIGGSDVGTLANDVIGNISLLAGDVGTEYNFADSNTAITGFVYVDANNDGIKDTGETGIQGVTLTLTGTDSNSNPVNQTTTTDANGAYSITGMLASDANGYTVTETHPTAWADGKDTAGNAGGSAASNDLISGIIIGSSTRAENYNFGELGAALSGIVYNDNGDDGQKENSDPGIGGVTITLTGTDLNSNPVSLIVVTGDDGAYRFDNLPLPNGSGYTITETQPPGVNDGKENTSNVITGVTITTPGVEETGFNFGEIIPSAQTASVSGRVHDRDDLNTTHSEWIVEIVRNGLVVATTITESSGYRFDGLTPGSGYEIHFRHPESNAVFGVLENLTLTANTELPNQNLPLDPSGVVYDSVTRQPVPGAIVTLSGPSGFNPATDLIGGTGNVNQTVGSDGLYKYLLNPTAPAGIYSLSVLQPTGYLPPNSLNIPAPCANTLVVGAVPAPAQIQPQVTAPAGSAPLHDPANCPALGASGTQYYLSFNLSAVSADLINNHIPLDPSGQISGLTVVKSTPKANVTRGELVPYSIRITNNLATPITNIRIRDQIPPGFKYVANSAILDGSRIEPAINNRELTWPAQDYAVGQTHEVKLILVIGAGVGEGEYINQAWGINGLTNSTATIIAEATVRIIPDPTFDCSDLIGKVFDDKNTNGYQDEGELGLPGIRVVTARGLVITTDANGRYHVPCAAVPNELRGSNFILKLDEQTLPSGYRITTENPRVIRMTRGKLAKLNFGAAIHRVVRLDLNAKAYDQDSDELRSDYEKHMQKLLGVLSKEPSVLRVAYAANGEDKNLVKDRLRSFRNHLESIWGDCDCNHELIIEQEVLWEPAATRGSVSTGRAK